MYPSLDLLSLERLSVRDARDEGGTQGESPSPSAKAESVDAPPKRKSPAAASSSSAAVVRHDSGQVPVRLILLSRFLETRDEARLVALAASPVGAALLASLRDTFLHAARAIGGATAQALTPTNVQSLFNASGSTLARPALYEAQLSVPQRLPFAAASVVYRALLEAVADERHALETREGMGEAMDAAALLATSAPSDPSIVARMGESIRRQTQAMLAAAGGARNAASSAASSSAASTTTDVFDAGDPSGPMWPPPVPLPLPMPPPAPTRPLLALPSLEPANTLRDNLTTLVSGVAFVSDADRPRVEETLDRCLDLLDPMARPDLHAPLLVALVRPAVAQLLAQLLEAIHDAHDEATRAGPGAPADPTLEGVLTRVLAGCTCAAGMHCSAATLSAIDDDETLSALIYDALDADGERDDARPT